MKDLGARVAQWRRVFHGHPELGFLEYRTAALVCAELTRLSGWKLRVGREVMLPEARMNVPEAADHALARDEAVANGADASWISRFGEGLTGVVADWTFDRPGPVVAFRFDMDALPVTETADPAHRPNREGFASRYAGRMHACGHDAHTAMGLGLASIVSQHASRWSGTLRLIFQPAEEGCRGARSMVAAGVVDDVDWMICGHIGVAAKRGGVVICAAEGLMAATVFDVRFRGEPSHAGLEPHRGRNALLAASTCALQLHALPRHGDGVSRVNVGLLQAGTATNIIARDALLKFEVRGATSAINHFMAEEGRRIVETSAAMYGVAAQIDVVGEASGAPLDRDIIAIVRDAASRTSGVTETIDSAVVTGSEDATLLIEAVQARGGQGTYLMVGSQMPAGHHHDAFDLEDDAMTLGVELYASVVDRLLGAGA